ncbi:unnamed protein product [Closterium sp. NIES-64]|nr:unnamed protein product [Closterium sp. NIES-64]
MASYCRTVVPSAIPSSSFSPFRLDPPLFPHICSPALLPTPVPPPCFNLPIPVPSPWGASVQPSPALLSPSTSPLGFGGGGDGSSATLKITPVGLIVPLPFFLPFPPPLFLPCSPSPPCSPSSLSLSPSLPLLPPSPRNSQDNPPWPHSSPPSPAPPPCSPSLFPSSFPLLDPPPLSYFPLPPPLPPPPPQPRPLTMGRKRAALPRLLSPSSSPLGFGGGVDGSNATFKIALLGLAACLFCLLILVIVVLFALLISMRWSSADVAASLAARESLTAESLRGRKAHPGMVMNQQGMVVYIESLRGRKAHLGMVVSACAPSVSLSVVECLKNHTTAAAANDTLYSLPPPTLSACIEVPNTTAAAGSSSSQNPSKKANNEDGAANNEDRDPAGGADDDDEDDDEAGGGGLSSRRKEGARKLQQWREFFGGVVLVLHFSRPVRAWQTLEFWRHVYGRVFDNMVTVSTEAIPELGVIAATPSPAANTDASLSYTALPTIMEQHASASGFLWLDDDAVLNYWALADAPLDKNKIWYLNSSNPSHLLTLPLDQPPSAPIRTALDPADLPTHISTSLSHLSESLRAQLDRSLWPRHLSFPLAASTSSAFFIPQRLVDSAALHVIPVFAAEAIPAQCVLSWVKQTHSAALHVIPVFAFIAIPAQVRMYVYSLPPEALSHTNTPPCAALCPSALSCSSLCIFCYPLLPQVAIPLILFTLKHPNQCISPTVPLTTPLLSPHPCSPHTPALPTPLLSPHPCSPLLPQVATPLILFTLQHPKQVHKAGE